MDKEARKEENVSENCFERLSGGERRIEFFYKLKKGKITWTTISTFPVKFFRLSPLNFQYFFSRKIGGNKNNKMLVKICHSLNGEGEPKKSNYILIIAIILNQSKANSTDDIKLFCTFLK